MADFSVRREKRFGIMLDDIHLLGTSLKLQAGQRVCLEPANNSPAFDWYASPADGKWSDGIDHGLNDSIALFDSEFTPE